MRSGSFRVVWLQTEPFFRTILHMLDVHDLYFRLIALMSSHFCIFFFCSVCSYTSLLFTNMIDFTLWLSLHISLSPLLPCHLLLLSYALVALVGLFIDVYFHEIHYLVEFSTLWIKCVWNVFWVKNVKWKKCFSKVQFSVPCISIFL